MRVLDLFSGGAGGWSLGLHRAGFTTVAACEFDAQRRAAFAHNNPGVSMYDDIRQLSATRLRRDLGFLPEVVAGSPPCQDASTANPSGKGIEGERTGLFKDYVRLVREIRPRWVAAENVPGFRTRGADWLLDALEALGYTCWPLVVGAVHAGAPHLRKRVWFVASDPAQVGRREGWARRSAVGASRSRHEGRAGNEDDSQPYEDCQPHGAQHEEVGWKLELSGGDSDQARLAQRQSERGHARPEFEALERAVGARGMRWNNGPARSLGMADGVPTGLALDCIAAYGDAVVPQLSQAIGNAIRRTEMMMRADPA